MRWAKKIRGRLHYFGRWGRKQGERIVPVQDVKASAREAVNRYNQQRDDLYDGRVLRPKEDGCYALRTLCNEFLTAKMNKVESGGVVPPHARGLRTDLRSDDHALRALLAGGRLAAGRFRGVPEEAGWRDVRRDVTRPATN